MDNILKIVADNYIVFIVISVFLILAIIGYIVNKVKTGDVLISKGKPLTVNMSNEETNK